MRKRKHETLLQDGLGFFWLARFHIACVIMEEKLPLSVEQCLEWCVGEYFQELYNLNVERHDRTSMYREILAKVKHRWLESEVTFYAVFRGPRLSWDDDIIGLKIVGRDLYINYLRD